MDELTREFLIESQEGLDRMERCLTELEERPEDAGLIGDIFRSVHTIKGTTGFLGFKRLEKLAHAGENLLGILREGKLTTDRPITTGLLQLMDGLRSILKSIEVEGNEGDAEDSVLIARLEELQAPALGQPKQARVHAGAQGSSATADEPTSEDRSMTAGEREPQAGVAAPPALEAVGSKGQEKAPVESEAEVGKPRVPAAGSAAESTLRVDVALLNRMMNLVGELVLTRNQVLQATAADPNLTLLSRRLDMVTADLRENVMKARMQPVSNIFSKMPRIVRDLSQMLGRRVRLQMEGQDTELDKSLLEAIKDPLTHAVRNSLDHGIEPPDVRQAAGKDPEGTLRLRAVQEGNREAAMRTLAQDLSPKIHALTQPVSQTPHGEGAVQPGQGVPIFDRQAKAGNPQTQSVFPGVSRAPLFSPSAPHRAQPISSRPTILAIGVSTGGPAALDALLPQLPADFPLPVVIVQHMPELFTKLFAERLNTRCRLRVREAAEGDPLRIGTIFIAKGNWHLEVLGGSRAGSSASLRLSQGPLENHCRPAVDVLFRSVAAVYGAGVLAVVLTGMGSDGMLGCRIIRENGGAVLAQDQASSIVWGMPGAVVNAGLAHKILPLNDLAPEIIRLANRTHSEARELRESVV